MVAVGVPEAGQLAVAVRDVADTAGSPSTLIAAPVIWAFPLFRVLVEVAETLTTPELVVPVPVVVSARPDSLADGGADTSPTVPFAASTATPANEAFRSTIAPCAVASTGAADAAGGRASTTMVTASNDATPQRRTVRLTTGNCNTRPPNQAAPRTQSETQTFSLVRGQSIH